MMILSEHLDENYTHANKQIKHSAQPVVNLDTVERRLKGTKLFR